MKSRLILLGVTLFAMGLSLHAQSARQLTRKVVPPPAPSGGSPSAAPARPAAPAAPTTPPGSPSSTAVPAPPPPADPEKAKQETIKRTVEFQKKRAEEGSAASQYELGLRYLKGDGVEKDEAAGWKWIQASATNGYSLAVTKLEDMPKPKKK